MNPRLRYPKKSSRRCRAHARLIRPRRIPRLASSATGGARLVIRLRYPKKSSRRCRAHARLIRPLRDPRLASSATGGARLVTPLCRIIAFGSVGGQHRNKVNRLIHRAEHCPPSPRGEGYADRAAARAFVRRGSKEILRCAHDDREQRPGRQRAAPDRLRRFF